jgi:hypothetical protein
MKKLSHNGLKYLKIIHLIGADMWTGGAFAVML